MDNTLMPYPGRIGNGEQAALLSSSGDGIHSLGATYGPLISGNTLLNMGDDGITVHGLFFLVVKVGRFAMTDMSSSATAPCRVSNLLAMCQWALHQIAVKEVVLVLKAV